VSLLLPEHIDELKRNGFWCSVVADEFDPWPVVKLFTPDAGCTWLITAIDTDDEDILWGLCDLGLGFAEYGTVRLSEITGLRGKLGLPVERDLHFKATAPISAYIEASYPAGRIIINLPAAANAS